MYFPKSCGKLLWMTLNRRKKIKNAVKLSISTGILLTLCVACSTNSGLSKTNQKANSPAVSATNEDLERKQKKEQKQFLTDRSKILKVSATPLSSRLELGHLALKQKRFGEALVHFNGIIAKSKNTKEVRMAYLGKLEAFQRMRLIDQAQGVAKQIQKKYPNTEEARLAEERISARQ